MPPSLQTASTSRADPSGARPFPPFAAPCARIARRVLRLKFELGLFGDPRMPDPERQAQVSAAAHTPTSTWRVQVVPWCCCATTASCPSKAGSPRTRASARTCRAVRSRRLWQEPPPRQEGPYRSLGMQPCAVYCLRSILRTGCPVVRAMVSQSWSQWSSVRPASSAAAATRRSTGPALRCSPLAVSCSWTTRERR
jgi:hypothetical protein